MKPTTLKNYAILFMIAFDGFAFGTLFKMIEMNLIPDPAFWFVFMYVIIVLINIAFAIICSKVKKEC